MKKIVTVYGVEFESISNLFKVLGYKQSLSASVIKRKYGDLETMCRVRLGTNDVEKIRAYLTSGGADRAVPGLGLVAKMCVRRCLSSAAEEQTIIECATLAGVAVDADGMKAIKTAIGAYQMSLDPSALNI